MEQGFGSLLFTPMGSKTQKFQTRIDATSSALLSWERSKLSAAEGSGSISRGDTNQDKEPFGNTAPSKMQSQSTVGAGYKNITGSLSRGGKHVG
mmetsp:Transcript_32852/g.50244  ORF Transcript_32852/g.50244 Transcript_32852/m.50244 type:complete len:94 (-) Transcript_32852:893-1174(-)